MMHHENDQMDMLLAVALKDADISDPFSDLDVSSVSFSQAYLRKRKRNIFRKKHASGLAFVGKIGSRVAILVACFLAVGVITIMSISALRDAIRGAIIEWYDDYISIRFETETEDVNSADAETEEKTTDELWQAIDKVRKPTDIPPGVEEVILSNNKARVLIEYYSEGMWYATYRQSLFDGSADFVDNEGVIIQYIDILGQEAVVFESSEKQEISIMWTDGKYLYSIVSCGTVDALISLAKSVQ